MTKPSQAKPSQAKPSQAKPSQAKPRQAKPRQAKVSNGGGDLRKAQVDVPLSVSHSWFARIAGLSSRHLNNSNRRIG